MRPSINYLPPILPWLTAAILLASTGACATDAGSLINRRIQNPFATSAKIPVFFATNRVPISLQPSCTDSYYGVRNSRELAYGLCEIGVPKRHAVGDLEPVSISRGDADRYYTPGRHSEYQAAGLIGRIAAEPTAEILLFVHGFNVKFEEAALRAAQLAYDVKFQGSVVLFTWPAGSDGGGPGSLLINQTYGENQTNARDTIRLFEKFLRELKRTGKTIHILAHSMGHQIVLPALADAEVKAGPGYLGEVILNAPDFPARDLLRFAPQLTRMSKRVTLYCSPGDNALVASAGLNSNHRAGLCGRIPGIDVINVNELDTSALGHGYYSGRAVLTDVYQILLGVDVERRLFIRRSDPGGGEDYILRK
ncbi:MAG: alpha/beta hydrolase [Leptospirales bacterium]|jgi:esterase/lipase superfamily enzyme